MILEETFRWFGPHDSVPLTHIRQTGATGVVTALHHIPTGEVWTVEEISRRRKIVEEAGLTWSVVESLTVHEEIKARSGQHARWIENYRQSLRNLATSGPHVVTYNFMPVLDWVRTDLNYELPNGARTVRFEPLVFALFELFILKRAGAEKDYPPALIAKAEHVFRNLKPAKVQEIERNIIDNFPGCPKGTTLEEIRGLLKKFDGIDRAKLKEHLKLFLEAVVPVAEECGIRLVLHPDDPPFSVLGLPRIFSVEEDIRDVLAMVKSPANGVCFCAGSFSARPDNNLPRMLELARERVGFMHLRSTLIDDVGSPGTELEFAL